MGNSNWKCEHVTNVCAQVETNSYPQKLKNVLLIHCAFLILIDGPTLIYNMHQHYSGNTHNYKKTTRKNMKHHWAYRWE